MKRLWLAVAIAAASAACFDFDGAYASYCARNSCDGGVTGGGSAMGGGSTGGGSAAGGSAGGSTAGGSTAGGSTAGGSTAGGSTGGGATGGGMAGGGTTGGGMAGGAAGGAVDAGAPDAGVQCVGAAFCIHRQTQRTDFKVADAIVGTTLDSAAAVFSRFTPSRGSIWVTHGNDPTPSAGSSRPFTVGTPPHQIFSGTPFDFLIITESDMTTARIQRVIDGGLPQVRFSGTCMGAPFLANAYERVGDRVIIGGYDESLCELSLMTGQTMLLQAENGSNANEYVNDLYVSPGNEIFWGTSDGYVGKLGVGRISGQLDPDGIAGLDGIDGDNVWAVGYQSRAATRMDDGGFAVVHDFSGIASRSYSLKVTADGIFVGAFGGVAYKTRFTDGGFELFPLPVDPIHRVYEIAGGPEAIHVAGDEGSISNVSSAFFFSLIPRTR